MKRKYIRCLKCEKKDQKIKELKEHLKIIHKKKNSDGRYLKFMIAEALHNLNLYDINAARKTLKDIGGVQQYHNYPLNKKPKKPDPIWIDGKIY